MTDPGIKLSTSTRSSAADPNPEIVDLTDSFRHRDNRAFFAEVRRRIDDLAKKDRRFAGGGRGAIGLIGELGPLASGIRYAQRHLRRDRQPSYWSHCFLFARAIAASGSAPVFESTFDPAPGYRQFRDWNGVSGRKLSDYWFEGYALERDHCVPNVAVIVLGLGSKRRREVLERADRPLSDKLRYDLPALLGTWYAWLTNQASLPNPMTQGVAMASSAYVQFAYEAAAIDLALGSHQPNICPEHIWQTARYFYEAYERPQPEAGREGAAPLRDDAPIRGFTCIRDVRGGLLPEQRTPVPPLSEMARYIRVGGSRQKRRARSKK